MKKSITFFISFFLFVTVSDSQASFTMSSSACVNVTIQATAGSGTISNPSYTWLSSPAGVVFSSTNSASPVLTFTAAGNYSVLATVTSGSLISYFQNTITINAAPNLTLAPTSNFVCAGFTSTLSAFGANSYTWTGSTFTGGVTQQSVSVGPGTYSVLGSNVSGCISQNSTITIGLAAPLNISISASSPTTCITNNNPKLSNPVILYVTGAANYSLLPPPIPPIIFPPFPVFPLTVRPQVTTQYTVIGANSVCSGTAIVTVSVLPQFTIAVTPSLATICAGDAITLSLSQTGLPSSGPFTYSWTEQDQLIVTLNSNLSPSVIASPLSKRSYSLELSDANNCVSAPASLTIDVSPCTQIDENFGFKPLHVFPNPFDRELFIQGHSTELSAEIMDCFGKLILRRQISSLGGLEVIRTEDLSTGIYFLQIFSQGEKLQTLKIIKN